MGESVISKGARDTSNRYKATVLVDGGRGTCSGVLMAPRVVLTAGHCVCFPREARSEEAPARTVIDKTTCAQTTTVKVFTYQSMGRPRLDRFTGAVRPHERLRILYNDDEKELASDADLAVIALAEPPPGVTPIRLAKGAVRYAQRVTLAGFGASGLAEAQTTERRYGLNEVATIAEDGATFLVGKPIEVRRPYKPKELVLVREDASYSLAGDSGGPCLRESNESMELVGIAKTHYGGGDLVQFSEYTSTLFYRAWLLQAIADVERRGTD
jgi:secreted trypsin-like serine protease